jgi:hypothetical protein
MRIQKIKESSLIPQARLVMRTQAENKYNK